MYRKEISLFSCLCFMYIEKRQGQLATEASPSKKPVPWFGLHVQCQTVTLTGTRTSSFQK